MRGGERRHTDAGRVPDPIRALEYRVFTYLLVLLLLLLLL
jgi:hypothetical protein